MKPGSTLPGFAVVLALLGGATASMEAAAQAGGAPAPAINAGASDIPAEKATPPLSAREICLTLARTAMANDLPIDFFTRLIWRESQFNANAVSYAGAQGIAQFMPRTAAGVGLEDPFDPLTALQASGKFLAQLRTQFGNLGLAAAAYNAGPGRVQAWLGRRASLPRETRIYVFAITTIPAEKWIGIGDLPEHRLGRIISCDAIAKLLLRTNRQRRQQPTPSKGR